MTEQTLPNNPSNPSYSNESAKIKLAELAQKILAADKAYHQNDAPILSDADYDALKQENKAIESQFPHLIRPDSPTNRVGYTPSTQFNKITHLAPMLSLNDVFSSDDVVGFCDKVRRFLNLSENQPLDFVAEPKIDGLSFSALYKKGVFVHGATRGDGKVGEEITQNLKMIPEFPTILKNPDTSPLPDIIEIRGEVYMAKSDFFALNESCIHHNQKPFANPRNAAAGALRQLDASITKNRKLSLFAYAFGAYEGAHFATHIDFLRQLKTWGFPVNPYIIICNNIVEMMTYFNKIIEASANLDYDIDGIVYKGNDIALQERLGQITRSPRWAIAHKFPAQQAITTIENIRIQVGRTGALTPVADVMPINVGGVIVAKATLHNNDEIMKKDIRINDYVIIQRAGDVIPQIVRPLIDKRGADSLPYVFPTHCPVCGSRAKKEGENAIFYCTGDMICPAQQIEKLCHFASKNAFDIEGLGDKNIALFFEKGWIKNALDIFLLQKNHYFDIVRLDSWGVKSANKLFQGIEDKKTISLPRFIYALGIREVGQTSALLLAKRFSSWQNLYHAMQQENATDTLLNIAGIGVVMAKSLVDFFTNSNNTNLLEKLSQHLIITDYIVSINTNSPLLNKNIVFTGTLSTFTRNEAKSLATKAGAHVLSQISQSADYIIAGENAGSKLKKAHDLKIIVLKEKDFKQMLDEAKKTWYSIFIF